MNEGIDEDSEGRKDEQVLMTLLLLQALHAHTLFQLSVLESFVLQAQPQSDFFVILHPPWYHNQTRLCSFQSSSR